ncbi:MAG: hypothetical protein KDA68_12850 [Planctomycetaceae bacterium]|nr:hypothetical protein [Planctomycetaceae bacterium]
MNRSQHFSSKILPRDLILELEELGYTTESDRRFFETLWRSKGRAAISQFLSGFEVPNALRDYWLPRLLEYSAECRTTHPLPTRESLSPTDLAQFQIYLKKIVDLTRKGSLEPRRKHDVVFLFTAPTGLLAAEDILGPSHDSVIRFPLTNEAGRFDIFMEQEGRTFGWYSTHHLLISSPEELPKHDAQLIADNFPQPDGFEYWVLSYHYELGDSAAGMARELWKWDGSNPKCVSKQFH